MTHEALIPNRNRTEFLRVHHRDEDLPVLREVFLADDYRMGDHVDAIKGRVCIDVGANIGCVTLQLLDMGARHVIAVEPEPVNRDLAYANIIRNGYIDRVTLLPVAVGNPALSPTVELVGTSGTAHSEPEPGGVTVVDFANVLRHAPVELEETIAMLKVDVEGAEYDWFDTASYDLLDGVDWIAMEYHGPDGCPHLPVETARRYGELLTKLSETHSLIGQFGPAQTGGHLYLHSLRI